MTIPASLLMRRVGRQIGFIMGSMIGVMSGLLCAFSVFHSNFWLFAFGTFLFGLFAGFAQLYRFTAANVASEDFKSKAISLVLAGGVVSGFLGPESAKFGQNLINSIPFVGAYLILMGVTVFAIFVLFSGYYNVNARKTSGSTAANARDYATASFHCRRDSCDDISRCDEFFNDGDANCYV